MTSTTPFVFPASTGAGSAEFAAPADLGSAPADAARAEDGPSFEDLCARERDDVSEDVSESDAEADADSTISSDAQADDVAAADDDTVESADDDDDDDDDNDDDDTHHADVDAEILPLVTTSIRDAAMLAVAPVATQAAADCAAQGAVPPAAQAQAGSPAATTTPVTTQASAKGDANAQAATTPATAQATGGTAKGAAIPGAAASAPATAETKAVGAAKSEGEPSANSGSSEREKSAVPAAARAIVAEGAGEKNFLSTGSEAVARANAVAGTGVANQADTMKPAVSHTAHPEGRTAFSGGRGFSTGERVGADEISVAWKGWTNGGGERVSTAAQFSRFGDSSSSPSAHASVFAGAATPAARTPAVTPDSAAMPTTRPYPADPAALLAPIGAAIERLVANGRDQLSLTVRFEQGGSLSLKLAMRDGQVATQIHTDVPGLENAIKSSWGQLAQDWQGRGMKLADPQFTGGGSMSQHDQPAPDGRSAGREFDRGDAGASSFFSRSASSAPATRRSTGAAPADSATSPLSAAAKRRGLLTWA